MRFENKWFNKFWKFSTSFQLGIPILVSIAILIAYGTIVESRYDAYAAKRIVYESWMMLVAMVLLIYNLTIVMVDRMPWQLKHYPFIFVHIGIIVIILGGFVTQKFGVDGSMSVPIAGKNNFVAMPQTDLVVYATFDGDRYSKMFEQEVDFFKKKPSLERPFRVSLNNNTIEVIDYVPYARLAKKVKPSLSSQAGSSVRFQLMNSNVKQVETITQVRKNKTNQFNFGPAQVFLGEVDRKTLGKNEIYLTPKNDESLTYSIFRKDQAKVFKTGTLKIGDVVDTGWMGMELRLLDYIPRATEEWDVTRSERPTPLTTAAIQIRRAGDLHWLVLNDILKIFGTSEAYLITYQNRRLDLGFPIALKGFKVSRYEGSMKAMAYESEVTVGVDDGVGGQAKSAVISMNEPLKHAGYTIYQASFQEDEVTKEPTASVFSINYDPGRWIKYFGSLIMSIGIVWLFYQKRKRRTAV
ncbi:MAG: cytochrome c biogenesis protein [Bdellovibrionales bacterium RIFCSPHIGHO2_01_FULL_40_29]|nr:MAG: cytochrome c biogenesis protein [Bdellovibrionales bacterium RIFCSPHIGHO2_01_FULL_40_29]OFZ34529.1 MAG: cytochrome c biogenesis protein [Bdellovibrionales bacterium RIFCSPHIGHO2_02_FULL_40_15]